MTDDACVFEGPVRQLRVRAVGKTKIEIASSDGISYFITGPNADMGRRPALRSLVRRYNAATLPPRMSTMSDRQWKGLAAPSIEIGAGVKHLRQQALWQPVLLGALWARHARSWQATAD